jgi:hypothetical protein
MQATAGWAGLGLCSCADSGDRRQRDRYRNFRRQDARLGQQPQHREADLDPERPASRSAAAPSAATLSGTFDIYYVDFPLNGSLPIPSPWKRKGRQGRIVQKSG